MAQSPSDTLLPQDGVVRPAEMDLAARIERRADNLPEPPDELREWETAADRRMCNRPYPPNIILEPDGAGGTHWTAPHADGSLWILQLCDAFGTRSQAIVTTFLRQLQGLTNGRLWDEKAQDWRVDEIELSAMLAIINSLKPRNEMEACLAAQMVAVHLMQMKLSAHALKNPHDARTAAVAGKLARTFTGQIDAMQGLKGKRRTVKQTITVRKETHQHVHYHDHRGAGEGERQSHAPDGSATARISTVSGEDEDGRVVPFSRRSRKAGV
jgi:hypothetical protein